jgi:hypothetical protein
LHYTKYDNGASAHELSALLPALTGHATLERVELRGVRRHAGDAAAAAEDGHDALATALVAADAPALRELYLHGDAVLSQAQLPALFRALARNQHLRTLHVDVYVGDGDGVGDGGDEEASAVTAELVREQLLPALRRNGALRRLRVRGVRVDEPTGECVAVEDDGGDAWREADELLAARAPAHDAD